MGDRDPKAADQLYTIEFNHGGVRWCFEIYAHDDDDARQRLASIRANARVGGALVASVPVRSWMPLWLAALWAAPTLALWSVWRWLTGRKIGRR